MTKEFAAALIAAGAEFKAVTKNAQNPHLKNRYADLGAVLDEVKPTLARHGMTLLQQGAVVDGAQVLRTTLLHESGDHVGSEMLVVVPPDAKNWSQALGAAWSYARRYSIMALCGLYAGDDDDAASADRRWTRDELRAAVEREADPARKAEMIELGKRLFGGGK